MRRFNSGETEKITWYVGCVEIPIIVFINKMDREGKTLLT
jgi:peptide subunit release factor RF-3